MKKITHGGFLMAKIHQLSGRIFAKMLKAYDVEINPAQGRIMFVLWRQDEIPINELAQKTSLGKSTLTSMLDRLEDMGLILRIHSKQDRRQILIKRTEKDKSFQDLYMKVSHDMADLYYRGFSEKEIDAFEGYLRRIFDNLETIEKNVDA